VAEGTDGRLRLRLAADSERLEFLRVLRSPLVEVIETRALSSCRWVASRRPRRPSRRPREAPALGFAGAGEADPEAIAPVVPVDLELEAGGD
jgi:rod shape-determining protein MreC